jgi:hypothetical protein
MLRKLTLGAAIALVAVPVAAAELDCGGADLVKSAKLKIEACVDPADWAAGQGTGDQEFVYFSRDQKAGFAIVTEEPAVDMDAYHDAIIAFATKQSAAAEGSVASYDDATQEINGKTWGTMHYDVTVQGSKLEFLNYYYSEEGLGSTQFIFWSLPEDAGTVSAKLADKVIQTATVTE